MRTPSPHALSKKTKTRGMESSSTLKKRIQRILRTLEQSIPVAEVALNSSNPLELLVATILSAQCTDERVNQVTPKLFSRFKTAEDYAEATQARLEEIIRPTGFYQSKARHLMGCGKVLQERFDGQVPETMEALTSLPGVGRKTANVILGNYFGKPAIVVDTHVKRVSNRLGFTNSQDPTKIEADLQRIIPPSQWTIGAQRLLLHGRHVCQARTPQCQSCDIFSECGWEGKRTPL